MNILLITNEFSPRSMVAAVRPVKLYKYWKREGHSVKVLTSLKYSNSTDFINLTDEIDEKDIIRIDTSVWFESLYIKLQERFADKSGSATQVDLIATSNKPSQISLFGKIKKAVTKYYWSCKYKNWIAKSKKFLIKKPFGVDFIFSTFGPKPTLEIGKIAKSIYKNATWVADFRDPPIDNIQQVKISNPKNFAAKICKKATMVTAVSRGCLDECYLPKDYYTQIVTNGYDWDDRNSSANCEVSDKFKLVLTGKVYKDDSFVELFEALRECITTGIIDKDKLEIVHAGWQGEILYRQAKACGLENILVSKGIVARNEALKLQNSASVLLIETWNSQERRGVIGGKIYEYMTANKPLLAVVNGDLPNSEIGKIINECELGYCYEKAINNYEGLVKFLSNSYSKFATKPNDFEKNKKIEKYNYANIAKQIIDLAKLGGVLEKE